MPITEAEAKQKIIAYCNKDSRGIIGFFSTMFTDKTITVSFTQILQQWQKDANLVLPQQLSFAGNFVIDKNGLSTVNKLIPWHEVIVTATTRHLTRIDEYNHKTDNYFLACLKNGDVIEKELGDIKKYSNLLGHFIELYKNLP